MGKIDKLLDAIDAKDASEIKKRLNTIGTKTALKEVKDQLGIEARIMNNKGQLSKRFLEELRKAREEERIHEKAPEPKTQESKPETSTPKEPQTKLGEQIRNAQEKAIENVEFLCHDAKDLMHEQITLPAEDNSIDVIIARRGPLHWLEDARRVGHPGTVMIQLCPMEEPIPAWSNKLPHVMHYENCGRYTGAGSIHQSVENRLNQNGFMLHSGWGFDVPEIFDQPEELYKVLTWGLPADEIPAYEDVEHRLLSIFEHHAEAAGIILRHCRYLWKANII
ncbi:MAG: hypothetical protein IIB56_20135 [Planctomycetes bacterium]|nr:hypothetical protein [Planctomycetota bacterium]